MRASSKIPGRVGRRRAYVYGLPVAAAVHCRGDDFNKCPRGPAALARINTRLDLSMPILYSPGREPACLHGARGALLVCRAGPQGRKYARRLERWESKIYEIVTMGSCLSVLIMRLGSLVAAARGRVLN